MQRLVSTLRILFRDNRGVSAIEYGVIAALISVAASVAMPSIATSLGTVFGTASAGLSGEGTATTRTPPAVTAVPDPFTSPPASLTPSGNDNIGKAKTPKKPKD